MLAQKVVLEITTRNLHTVGFREFKQNIPDFLCKFPVIVLGLLSMKALNYF
jgi:hypothetical protein